jgi:hypothetical protein
MEEGTYPARVVQIVDFGLQPQRPFKGEEKEPAWEIGITYEFVDEFMKDDDGNDMEDKPRWLSERMPMYSLEAERAKSTQRYNALDPKGEHGGDFSKLLDTPCLVTIVNNVNNKSKRIYENIAGVSGMRDKDKDKVMPLVNEPLFFDLDSPNIEAFEKLPKFAQKRVADNLNFEGSKLQEMLVDVEPPLEEPKEEHDDENPY